jgi:hypothetical protein
MDLPHNRLLGERHRASSTTHHLWHDFQQFEGTRVSRFIRRETSSQQEANVDAAINVLDRQTKLIIQRRILVCISKSPSSSIEIFIFFPQLLEINRNSISFADVTNNGRPMNASLSEDSVAETALAKKNSDGKIKGTNTWRSTFT